VGLRQVGRREGKSSQNAGKWKLLTIVVLLTLPYCGIGKSRTTRNGPTLPEVVIPRVAVKVQARYQPQELRFEICCDKRGNRKSLSRGILTSIDRIILGMDKRARKSKDKTIEQKLSAGIDSCSFIQGMFFLPLCPKSFKVTTDRHEASSLPNRT